MEDVELWLSELEGQVASEDFGKDLISVQNLQKKLGLLESDYNAHQDRIDAIKQQAKTFYDSGHFDAPMILRKQETLHSRLVFLRQLEYLHKFFLNPFLFFNLLIYCIYCIFIFLLFSVMKIYLILLINEKINSLNP